MRKLIALLTICLFVSCETKKEVKQKTEEKPQTEKKKKSDDKDRIGRYVYEDRGHVLHTKSGCKAVFKIPNIGTQPVTAIETEKILSIDYSMICSQCVTSDDLEYLSLIIKFNQEKDNLADSIAVDYDEYE